jgi:uncharacterized membrane protein YhaH (DUF805 family)
MDFRYLFFSLKGRISRMPFLIGMIVITVLSVVLDVIDAIFASDMATMAGVALSSMVMAFYALATYCGLTLLVKRIHDLGHSGWYVAGAFLLSFGANFLMLTPLAEEKAAIAGLLLSLPFLGLLVWLFFAKGEPDQNEYDRRMGLEGFGPQGTD